MELIGIVGRLIKWRVEGCIKLESCRLRFKRVVEGCDKLMSPGL